MKTALLYALIGLPLGFLVGTLHGKQIASLGVLVVAGLLIGAAIGTWRRTYAERPQPKLVPWGALVGMALGAALAWSVLEGS